MSSCVLYSFPIHGWQSVTAPLRDSPPQRNTAGCGEKVGPISTFFCHSWLSVLFCFSQAATVAQSAAAKTDRPHTK